MQDRFLRIADVRAATGLSRATIYRLVGRGTFPQRRELTPHCVGWLESEIQAWITTQAATPRQPPTKPNRGHPKGH